MARSDERAAVYFLRDRTNGTVIALSLAELQKQLEVERLHVVSDAQMRVLEAAQAWYDACEADGNYGPTAKSLAQAVGVCAREVG